MVAFIAATSVLAALVSGFALLAYAGPGAGPEPIAAAPAERRQPLAGEERASSAKSLGLAQARPAQQPAERAPAHPAPQAPVPPPQVSDAWQKMPKMKLEAVYGGPLRDTIVQRWRDPLDGIVCYLYLPIVAPTSPVQPNGFVHYGPNGIGSISCQAVPAAVPRVAERRQPAPAPAAHAPKPTAPAAAQ
ncbi:hypothetical protein KMZ29_11810 [Bradyrhizobium sediminis]|uniref:Uncharacterized protein n=1 Tax=Bradyrhizobium sediminis TaxID=2840469 RepID=A0A975NI54_9BRAD|nr:hypothetical protein [Bradyrhizobium sediminis]QWG15275.1 hypothetical protein KMZ29_11810 [Bradyrhizobium sediminis]